MKIFSTGFSKSTSKPFPSQKPPISFASSTEVFRNFLFARLTKSLNVFGFFDFRIFMTVLFILLSLSSISSASANHATPKISLSVSKLPNLPESFGRIKILPKFFSILTFSSLLLIFPINLFSKTPLFWPFRPISEYRTSNILKRQASSCETPAGLIRCCIYCSKYNSFKCLLTKIYLQISWPLPFQLSFPQGQASASVLAEAFLFPLPAQLPAENLFQELYLLKVY